MPRSAHLTNSAHSPPPESPAPMPVKLAASAFFAVLFPVYWYQYGLLHFLWISDVALFLTLAALWVESRFLNSMALLLAFLFELVWLVDFLGQLLLGIEVVGLAAYMFDPEMSLFMRGLSLFHLPMPVLWIWLLVKWGYEPRAFKPTIMLFVGLILASHGLTEPEENINWVFSARVHDWVAIPEPLWLLLYLLSVPLLWHWPAHALLKRKLPARG